MLIEVPTVEGGVVIAGSPITKCKMCLMHIAAWQDAIPVPKLLPCIKALEPHRGGNMQKYYEIDVFYQGVAPSHQRSSKNPPITEPQPSLDKAHPLFGRAFD